MITTEVRAFATLRQFVPAAQVGEAVKIELAEGAQLQELVARLNIPLDEVKVIMVNGRAQALDYTLQDHDRVGIFPAVGGG